MAIYRATSHGGFKLVHKNYEYYKTDKKLDGDPAWRCINFSGATSQKCNVRAYTRNFGMIDKVKIRGVHLHPPRLLKVSRQNKLKKKRL